MLSKRSKFVHTSPLALVTVAACGSNSDTSQTYSGNVINGPLNNALVFLDLNSNGILDGSEASVRTDANGAFTISTKATAFQLIAITDDTTIDTASGEVYSGVRLKAPLNASVITPTTTLMEEGNLTSEQVADVLGLPDGVDPLSFNPYAEGVNESDALVVAKLTNQLMTAVNSFAAAAEGAGAAELDAFEAALKSVVDVVKIKATKTTDAEKILDFTKTDDLNLIKAEAVKNAATKSVIDQTAFNALIDDTTTSIKNVNDQIASVEYLKSDETKLIFAQSKKLKDAVKAAVDAEQSVSGSGDLQFKDVILIKGTPEADSIKGGVGDETIFGEDGNDTLEGGDGNNIIFGGAGDDVFIYTGEGSDIITAGPGIDTLKYSNLLPDSEYRDGDDIIAVASSGVDTLTVVGAFSEENRLEKVELTDERGNTYFYNLYGSEASPDGGDNMFIGTDQNDVIDASKSDVSVVFGGQGDDIITGGSGVDSLFGGAGDDYLDGGDGGEENFILGGAGNDTIVIKGGSGSEVSGGDGDDIITGGGDFEITVRGENGNDTIVMDSGFDNIYGGAGDDYLDGGAGGDFIETGDGNDTIVIRKGDGGADQYADVDQVYDFTDGSDKIKLFGTTFSELSITQNNSDTLISLGDEYLATFSNFVATDLTEDDFVTYDIV